MAKKRRPSKAVKVDLSGVESSKKAIPEGEYEIRAHV